LVFEVISASLDTTFRDLLTFYIEGDKTGAGMENIGRLEPTLRIGSSKARGR